MRTEYLKSLDKINLSLVPVSMLNEYKTIEFQFDIKNSTYFSQNVFNNLDTDIYYVLNERELNKRLSFNENLKSSEDDYIDGFCDGFYNPDFPLDAQSEEEKIFEVFSMVYKKLNSINKPSILYFKKSVNAYNQLCFLQYHFGEYGEEVGRYIKSWTIILNNINLFENIFDKYFGNQKLKEKNIFDGVPFKVGLLFAKKEIFRKANQIGIFDYYHFQIKFDSVKKLSEHLKLTRQYINDTFNESDTNHNLYNTKQMKIVIDYCNENKITIHQDYQNKFDVLIQKQS